MRLTVHLRVVISVAMAACVHPQKEANKSMGVPQHIISLERSALDRWVRGDPDGYLGLYMKDATYFDPFREKRINGRDELSAAVAPMRGAALPFTEPRYDMVDPVVSVDGNVAVLTFNLVNYGKPAGGTNEVVLARWNATEVYRKTDSDWKIIHTHWSFTLPKLSGPPAVR